MTKEEFIEYTGEDPEDVLGPNWEFRLRSIETVNEIPRFTEKEDGDLD